MDHFNDWDLQAVVRSCSFAHTEEPPGAVAGAHHAAAAAPREAEGAAPAPAPARPDEAVRERRATRARAAPVAAGRASAAGALLLANNKEASSRLYGGLEYLDLDHKPSSFLLPPAGTTAAATSTRAGGDDGREVMISFPAAASTSGVQSRAPGRKAGARTTRPKRSKKSQLKKVVREMPVADGGVSSSDPWAWRKYGQKPIKGSPYPRGYYKCSSMKGCMARKLVERSPAKPGVLIVTYMAEHCHPVPTQLNALAGTTRHGKSAPAAALGEDHDHPAASSSPKQSHEQQGTAADRNAAPAPAAVDHECGGGAEEAAAAALADDESEFWPPGMDLDELLAPVDDDLDFDFEAALDDDGGGSRSS